MLGGEGGFFNGFGQPQGLGRGKEARQRLVAGVADNALRGGAAGDRGLDEKGWLQVNPPALIGNVTEDGATRLDLGHAGEEGRDRISATATARNNLDGDVVAAAQIGAAGHLCDTLLDGLAFLVGFFNRQRLAFPGHQATEAHARRLHDRACQCQGGFTRQHAGSFHAGVDLDHNAHFRANRRGCRANRRHILDVVDGDLDISVTAQIGQPGQLMSPCDLIGDQNVGDPGRDHYFRLT